MKHLKILSLAALAAFAVMAVVGAGMASASEPKVEPEGGTFPVSFTGKGGAGKLEVTPESGKIRTVNCTENTSTGEVNTSTTAKAVTVTFKGCTATGPFGIKLSCTTSGKSSGEIVTKDLKGTLVYLKAGSSETGILLQPESGTTFAEFTCGGVQKLTISGATIGKLTPLNTLTNAFTLTFTQTEGHQSPEKYLASSGCAETSAVTQSTGTAVGFGGENFGPRQSGIEGSASLTTSKKMKVVATKCE